MITLDIKNIFSYFLIYVFLLSVFVYVKNEWTFRQRQRILDAIYRYSNTLNLGEFANFRHVLYMYSSMEGYEKTLIRLYDWGLTHIVPDDVYKEIEPYIEPYHR